jgi:hypothetical protein
MLVVTLGSLLLLLMLFAYRRATTAQLTQARVQLQVDYGEKEESILRSIVAIVPNRAIRAMQNRSNANLSSSGPLSWESIFTTALDLANARQSISPQLMSTLASSGLVMANPGDAPLGDTGTIFKALGNEPGFTSVGINRSLGAGYPVPLSSSHENDCIRDKTWPIVSSSKVYGPLAQSGVGLPVASYPNFNLITYPNINFGYTRPGQPFVAKRNWWGFSVDLAEPDAATTFAVKSRRDFVLSLYEIPSQLPISASAFMELGQYAGGGGWQHVTIDGSIFAGRAVVNGTTALTALATRRGVSLSAGTTVGGQSFNGDPLTPGVREAYHLTEGDFFAVSQASESGRAAFIPINRGMDYFDRFAHEPESDTLSSTTWNQYSVGALQCAMRLDITGVASASNKTPTTLRFSYLQDGVRQDLPVSLPTAVATNLPPGYLFACNQSQTYDFGSAVVDVAFGANGAFAYKTGVTGVITFDVATFGDPAPGVAKVGAFNPIYPFELKLLPSGKTCIAVYPKRIPGFLNVLGADSTATNHSLVINVDYTVATGSAELTKPSFPCTDRDYGVIVQECDDLTAFPKGFSLVTNLRLYLGEDFNIVAATPPADYPATAAYYPPCSLFAPEKRYGVDFDPSEVTFEGQVGSVASDSASEPVRPLDPKVLYGGMVAANQYRANLRPITHPADLPPVFMLNWLILLEERKREFSASN